MKLNSNQIDFLVRHKVPLWYILDATWMWRKEYSKILNETDYMVAINSLSWNCNKEHLLWFRDRHWRCLECRVSNYSFIKPSKVGYVYVVWSLYWRILKVWYTNNLEDRLFHLKKDSYGWFDDWEFLYSAKYKEALKIESKIHSYLKKYWVDIEYDHYWRKIVCYELFKCSYKNVKSAIEKVKSELTKEYLKEEEEKKDRIQLYDFVWYLNEENIGESSLSIQSYEDDDKWFQEDFDSYLRKYWIYSWKYLRL